MDCKRITVIRVKSNKPYLAFFSPRVGEPNRFLILLGGKETDVIITRGDLIRILTVSQYADFVKGHSIFEVSRDILDPYLKGTNENIDRWIAQ